LIHNSFIVATLLIDNFSLPLPQFTMTGTTYHLEHASSGRAKCKKCKNQIEKGALRIGTSKSKYRIGSPFKSLVQIFTCGSYCVTNPVYYIT